jgi:putative transposase
VGSRRDSYDNAAQSTNRLCKTELITRRGPWRGLEDVEPVTLEWIDWVNHRSLHGCCHDLPPADYEHLYHQQQPTRNRRSWRTEPPLKPV